MEGFEIYVTWFNQNFIDFNLKLMSGVSFLCLLGMLGAGCGYPTDIVSCL